MESLDITTIILIVAVIVIFLKLRSVLGQRTGYQESQEYLDEIKKHIERREESEIGDNVVKLPTNNQENSEGEKEDQAMIEIEEFSQPKSDLRNGFLAILKSDPRFSPKEFHSGAEMAYEMIINAYADGDLNTLENLLAPDVFKEFKQVIDARTKNGEKVKSSFIGIDKAEIISAEIKDKIAHITLSFTSQITSVTYDKNDKIIDGDEGDVVRAKDIWTFARDLSSKNPNWKLIATEAEG